MTSSYLANECHVGDRIRIFIHRSSFKPPRDQATPLILIANGSGIAPFIGFLKEREFRKNARRTKPVNSGAVGEVLLFYGCRSEDEAPYLSLLNSYVCNGTITSFFPCFSQKIPKEYVQDRLLKESEMVLPLLEKNAHILVSGDAERMSKAVAETWIQMLQTHFKLQKQDATARFESLIGEKRYLEDVWSSQLGANI
ncbi:alpha component of sulfite reductase (NADPH) flavoprotein [Mitosporidium daphniae]|uniref:Alpha component of sulfite reductase (NADPH) flavoprotein n=1 Tax=Mitosporidium daphniae TaxID=1485682 RepID=A0A098VTF9_9MICR|nr:alpha component of sulfite reductase (NADPH) flavoprotein [Mitosporidium daphniae]KGG52114.1 alpha component of sulfite reductase (NADPH) flavoprotein [Mitosporidium daphniae]|eukprot:XP_013238541.1 alpha component of sulfite reductase (NADPH) flavoprotein [Mitosporidium daphniae]